MNLSKTFPIISAWKFFFALGVPLVLLPIPILWKSSIGYASYVVLIIASYWVTEAVPIAVTALLPVALYPLFGIQHSEVIAQQYLKDSVQLFIGGLLVALAFEYCGHHKRVALRVMLFTGTSIGKLLLGIMITTMFLSMWMFNTATTAMMVPTITSIIDELEKSIKQISNNILSRASGGNFEHGLNVNDEEYLATSNVTVVRHGLNNSYLPDSDVPCGRKGSFNLRHGNGRDAISAALPTDHQHVNSSLRSMKTMLLLGTCYSSNLGGTGVLTGSGTNLVAIEFLGDLDPKHHGNFAALTFASWMGFNVLPMLLCLIIAWIYLQAVFLGLPNKCRFWKSQEKRTVSNSIFTKEIEESIKEMLADQYAALGSFTTHEVGVLLLFVVVVTSWIFHEPRFLPGWSSWFSRKVSISSSSLLIGILFFVVPRNAEFYKAIKRRDFTGVKFEPLLDYEFTLKRFPWGVVILLGGGYALSNGAKAAGLSAAIGQSLGALHSLPPSMIQLCCMILIGFVTEVASNTATASIIIPVLLELELNIHPLYLTLPATTTCSYAFMLPVATPPNAIVYSAGNLKVSDMIKTGLFMNFACIFVLFVTTNLYGPLFFNFSTYSYVP